MRLGPLRRRVPWYVRIGGKLVLSRVPLAFSWWRRFSLFRHGSMHLGTYALTVLERHLGDTSESGELKGRIVMELGPGDGIASGLFAHALGANGSVLVDVGDFATRDMGHYHGILHHLARKGLEVSDLLECRDFESLCTVANVTYLTRGLPSLRGLAANSVDVQFSNAVLEHVRASEVQQTLNELYRVLRPGGYSSHEVDLKDHLGGGLNNLRFPERVWESSFFSGAGFYTNRVRFSDMVRMFTVAGFEPEVTKIWYWDRLPVSRDRLDASFHSLSDDELLVSAFDVVATKRMRNGPLQTDDPSCHVPCKASGAPSPSGRARC